jgi:hypothetical protein
VAAALAGLETVPVRVHPIRRDRQPDEFLVLLGEHNRQRVKTNDEKLREEIVSANPEEAYRSLIEHRREQSAVFADTLIIR